MKRFMIVGTGVLTLALALSMQLTGMANANHGTGTVYVDDDRCTAAGTGVGTLNDPFCTIPEAVEHASSGDIIRVAAGNYDAPVTVDKSVRLMGARAGDNPINGRSNNEESNITNSTTSFKLAADNIIVDGFRFADVAGDAGLYTSPQFSGYNITNNILENNTFGLALHSEGTNQTVVSRNLFQNNNAEGAASGNAIYSDQQLVNVAIERNKFTGHQNASITLASDPANPPVRSDIEISRNEVRSERTFGNIYPTEDLLISRNDMRNFSQAIEGDDNTGGSAIFLAGGSEDVVIERNYIDGAAFSGIRLRGDFGFGSNTDVTIERNEIRNVGDYGIGLAPGAVVGGVLERNETRNNRIDGIGIDQENTELMVERNQSFGNSAFDLRDSSAGSGDFVTANQYDRNKCVKDSPDGLCL